MKRLTGDFDAEVSDRFVRFFWFVCSGIGTEFRVWD